MNIFRRFIPYDNEKSLRKIWIFDTRKPRTMSIRYNKYVHTYTLYARITIRTYVYLVDA